MTGYVEFEFDLPGALLVRLIEVLDGLGAVPLNTTNLAAIPEEQGVYQLFLDDQLVYIGKTDADAGLHKRLSRHARKVMHRVGLDPARVSFKAVRVFVFTAVDLESDLIRHYGGVKAIDWNGSGFGSNDPGRERDTTRVDPRNFDAKFPIDIDREMAFAIDQNETAASALARLKDALPYTFRYQGKGGGEPKTPYGPSIRVPPRQGRADDTTRGDQKHREPPARWVASHGLARLHYSLQGRAGIPPGGSNHFTIVFMAAPGEEFVAQCSAPASEPANTALYFVVDASRHR
ncbi:GIY-YIG nuclease family protein [Rhizobium sp. WSM1325]|uniref:GIY-YIG nuclease family protein n=1 Tax=Rhizobium sp. WSM1325 TaxID=3444086 RepID=UPI001FE237AA|nr:GIY-YIG nuclease family protein [Rhizobium leguminosarum]